MVQVNKKRCFQNEWTYSYSLIIALTDEPAYVRRDNKHPSNVLVVAVHGTNFFMLVPNSLEVCMTPEQYAALSCGDVGSMIIGAYPLATWLIPATIRNVNANIFHLAAAVELFERTHRKT